MNQPKNNTYLSTSIDQRILTITIDREKQLNALNTSLLTEIKEVLKSYETNPDVMGVILTGAGQKAFAAGADIKEFADFSSLQGTTLAANGHGIMNYIEQYPKPVIAAVNGYALGGGCELAMACHLRIATDNARFGQPEVSLGIVPGYGGTQRLVQLIGKAKALELLMTGDLIKANEALRLGLVNHVVSQEDLLPKCTAILLKIATKAPLAIAKVIDCVNAYFELGRDGFGVEIAAFGKSFNTEDLREGTTAFLEKRKAEFKGK